MTYSFIVFYAACIIVAILDIYVMIKFLAICHTYAMLYYQRKRSIQCLFFFLEFLALLLFVFSKIGKDTLFPLKHTELIFEHQNIFERYKDILEETNDIVTACDSFNIFTLGIVVLKCFDHFGSQADNESS